jgi:hypothetical protein
MLSQRGMRCFIDNVTEVGVRFDSDARRQTMIDSLMVTHRFDTDAIKTSFCSAGLPMVRRVDYNGWCHGSIPRTCVTFVGCQGQGCKT